MTKISIDGQDYYIRENSFIEGLKDQYHMEGVVGNALMNQHRQLNRGNANLDRAVGTTAWFMAKGLGKASWSLGKVSWKAAKLVGKTSFKAGMSIKERASEHSDRVRFIERRGPQY